jgi:hypothetical protein
MCDFLKNTSDLANFEISEILKNDLRLTVSGLGAVTGTTGRVFLLISHPISSTSEGYEPTLNMFLVLLIFRKTNNLCSQRKICHTDFVLIYTHVLMFKPTVFVNKA